MLAACWWCLLLQAVTRVVFVWLFPILLLLKCPAMNLVFGLQTKDGCTPLHVASQNGRVHVVTALLAASANVDAATVCPELWTCSVYNCSTCVWRSYCWCMTVVVAVVL